MEAKLKEYRAIRRRKELIENAKKNYENTKDKIVNFLVPKIIQDMGRVHDDEVLLMENPAPQPMDKPVEEINDVVSEISEVEPEEENEETWRHCLIRWAIYAIIWSSLWVVFLKLQFGAVYFVISVLIGIYLNTRTRPRRKGEVSAYSVFNENCVSIDGTLTPEQFEREIRYGMGTVKIF